MRSPKPVLLAAFAFSCSAASPALADTALPSGPPRAGDTVVATLVDGDTGFFACGVFACIGVYVYEIQARGAAPMRFVVDVLCPDFYSPPVHFTRGARHKLSLAPAQRTYAGATPRPS